MIIRPNWTQQPLIGTPIRRDTRLAQGIYVAFNAGIATGTQANGFPTQVVDTYKTVPTQYGLAYSNTKTPKNGVKWQTGLPTPRPSNAETMISIARVTATSPGSTGSGFVFLNSNAAAYNLRIGGLVCEVWNGQRDCAFKFYLGAGQTSGDGVQSADVGVWYIHVGRWRSGDYLKYKRFNLSTNQWESEQLSASTVSGGFFYDDGNRVEETSSIGLEAAWNDSDGVNPLEHDNLLSVIWSRYLEDDELDQLVENPWQIFEPRGVPITLPSVSSVSTDDKVFDNESPWVITGARFGAR